MIQMNVVVKDFYRISLTYSGALMHQSIFLVVFLLLLLTKQGTLNQFSTVHLLSSKLMGIADRRIDGVVKAKSLSRDTKMSVKLKVTVPLIYALGFDQNP